MKGLILNFGPSPIGLTGGGITINQPGGDTISGNFFGFNPTDGTPINGYMGDIGVYSSNNTIGGTSPADRNVLAGGKGTQGIEIRGYTLNGQTVTATKNLVEGNLVGTNPDGTATLGLFEIGIRIENASDNTIGGTVPGAANLIAGNSIGISIEGDDQFPQPTSGNLVEGNFIGTNRAGIDGLGNGDAGIFFFKASNNTIGGTAANAANVIAFNGRPDLSLGDGVVIQYGTGDAILSNRIYHNGRLGIKLGIEDFPLVHPNDGLDQDSGPDNLRHLPRVDPLCRVPRPGRSLSGISTRRRTRRVSRSSSS